VDREARDAAGAVTITERTVGTKAKMVVLPNHGLLNAPHCSGDKDVSTTPASAKNTDPTRIEPVPTKLQTTPCLSEPQVRELGILGSELADFYGHPQDIEWALDQDGRILLLQAKSPISKYTVSIVSFTVVGECLKSTRFGLNSFLPMS